MANAVPESRNRDFVSVLAVWLLLAIVLVILALPNALVPGLFYDEAHCAGMATDFLTGHAHPHLRGSEVVNLCGRPFPLFVQPYGGAVKSWLLLPGFAIFGASQPVLRMTALGLGLAALLLFMLWTWHWLGKSTALVAGALLALDPAYFFSSVLDWGPALPSFLCRFACFCFALRWWRLANRQDSSSRRMMLFAFLAGLSAGLGFFNKIDFAVLLAGVLLALICCNARNLRANLDRRRFVSLAPSIALGVVGFLIAAGPMFPHFPQLLQDHFAGGRPNRLPGEMAGKFNVMLAMYDGSYFYRLMDVGGLFTKLPQARASFFAPIGIAMLLAAAYLIFKSVQDPAFRGSCGKTAAFLLLATLFITLGIFELPEAVRMHHAVLVYPFPQLVIAFAITRLWPRRLVLVLFALLLASQLFALYRTQQLICQTGGRGWWSDAISAFARQVKNRSDLTIVSLDWGFNEQLAFLTDGPKLIEPFWSKMPSDAHAGNIIYLEHSPEYRLYTFGQSYMDDARRSGPAAVDLQPWFDHESNVVFYSFRYHGP